jgi:hypothetical protein
VSTKSMKVISAIVPVLFGTAAAFWTPLDLWFDMKEGLIAFLGFLAAAVVQVMPVTANFLQSDRLSPNEAERLTASLTKQQHYWIGLLSAAVAAMVIVMFGAAVKTRVVDWPLLFIHPWSVNIGWGAVVCFLIVSSVSFVLMKMLGLFEGMLALHRLRGELVLNAANRVAAERIVALEKESEPTTALVPPGYGQVIRPH